MTGLRAPLLVCLVLAITQCQHKPTIVTETTEVPFQRLIQEAHKKIDLAEETLVIDARSSFSYSMAHLPESINLHWADFVASRGREAWLLGEEPQQLARRLQLKGVHPDRSIVILGDGLQGEGEEAWLAWLLAFLGVEKVQVASINLFQNRLTNQVTEPKMNAEPWKPELQPQMQLNCRKFKELVNESKGSISIIDVRKKSAYFNKPYGQQNLNSINIPWRNFFTQEGRVARKMKNELRGLGYQPSQPLVVLADYTLQSGAVSYALTSLGFRKVQNLAPGMKCFE